MFIFNVIYWKFFTDLVYYSSNKINCTSKNVNSKEEFIWVKQINQILSPVKKSF